VALLSWFIKIHKECLLPAGVAVTAQQYCEHITKYAGNSWHLLNHFFNMFAIPGLDNVQKSTV
jgi:hypothetical protein